MTDVCKYCFKPILEYDRAIESGPDVYHHDCALAIKHKVINTTNNTTDLISKDELLDKLTEQIRFYQLKADRARGEPAKTTGHENLILADRYLMFVSALGMIRRMVSEMESRKRVYD